MRGNFMATAVLLSLTWGCAAGFIKHEVQEPSVYTLGREVSLTPGLYGDVFANTAEEKCPEGYTVLERSRNPSTLSKVGVEPGNLMYYWVIKCQ